MSGTASKHQTEFPRIASPHATAVAIAGAHFFCYIGLVRLKRTWLITGGLVAMVLGIIFWVSNFVLQAPPGSALDTAKRFYWAIESTRYEFAYGKLHPDLGGTKTLAEFTQEAERHASLFQVGYAAWSTNIRDDVATVQGKITTREGPPVFAYFRLVHNGGGWKIAAYDIRDEYGNGVSGSTSP